jgi:hypothetical protein
MGSKRAPSAPNPQETAAAQGVINADTARTMARLNRGNTTTPFGTVTNRDLGNDQWETTLALSPEQQRIYRQGVDLETQTGQLSLDMLPEARRVLMQPMAMDDPDARERATAGIMSRMEPQFARDRAALESRLVAQGFTPGTEAFRQAADEQNRAVTDARLQAVTAGLGESRNAAAFNNAMRGQRINELGMVFGLGPGMQVPQQASLAGVAMQAPDLMGQMQANYDARSRQYAANMGAFGQLVGAAGSAFGGSTLGGRLGTAIANRVGL